MAFEQIIFLLEEKPEEALQKLEQLGKSSGVYNDDAEELADRFKLVYKDRGETYTYFRLKSGKYAIVKTLYREVKGFIIHGIIFDFLDFYPVELIGSPDFKEDFNRENETKALNVLQRGPQGLGVEVMNFISSRGEIAIENIINSLIALGKSEKCIEILDNKDSFIYWLSAIHMAFPRTLAAKITFTTAGFFEGECSIYLGNHRLSTRGEYLFDFTGGMSLKAKQEYRYTQIVKTGFFKSRNLLTQLHRFLEQFKYENLDENLDSGLILFLMLNFTGTKPSRNDVAYGLKFMIKHGDNDILGLLFEMHGGIFEELTKELNQTSVTLMIDFIIKASKAIKNHHIYDRALRVFYGTLDTMALNLSFPLDLLYKFYWNGERANITKPSFYKQQVSRERVIYIGELFQEKGGEDLCEFYAYIILNSFIKLGYTWRQAVKTEGFEVFIDNSIRGIMSKKKSTEYILQSFKESQEFLINIIILIYNRMESYEYMELLGNGVYERLISLEERDRLKFRRELFKMGGGGLLLEEFKVSLEKSDDKKEFFRLYCENVFSLMPEYHNTYYQQAVLYYLTRLKDEEGFEESIKFLEIIVKGSTIFDRNTVQGIMEVFERNLSLDDIEKHMNIIRNAARIKRARDIKTYPDVTYIIDLLYYMRENEEINVEELIEDVGFKLRGLSEEFIIKYLGFFFEEVLAHVKSKEDHRQIIDFIFKEDMDEKIIYYYDRILTLFASDRSRGYRPLVHFISYYFFYLEPFHRGKEDGIVEYIEKGLREAFEAEIREFLDRVDNDIREEFEGKGFSLPLKWLEMYTWAVHTKTFKGKIRKIFSKDR